MREDQSTEDIARATGFSTRTIARLRQEGRIPFVKLGPRTFRHNIQDVLEALKAAQRPGGAAADSCGATEFAS
jgi:excisionase family DNA binding protein